MAKRRKKIKYKNIVKLLLIVIFIVFIVKIILFYSFNNKIYNDIKNGKLTITSNKKTIRLTNSNVKYIKSKKIKVKIVNKNYTYIINNKYINKKTHLHLSTKKIKKYSNEAYYIDSLAKVNNKKMIINLPNYLKSHKYLDLYGYKNHKYIKIKKLKVKNSKISFTKDKKINKYFIVFVKLKNIVADDLSFIKGEEKKLKIKLVPKNVTIEKYKLNYDKKYIGLKKNKVISKKEGNTAIKVKVNNIIKKININIKTNRHKIIKKDGIYYIDDIMIVNKSYPIKKNYDPKGILSNVKKEYEKMKSDALKDGISLWIVSGYRSYKDQESIYNNYVKINSKKEADTYSARPGFSEHQTGLAMDLNEATDKFNNTKEASWLSKNAYKYGFIIRFPKGKEKYTGYKYESWHIRYVGKEKAKKITESKLSLEEYYGIESKYKD